MGKKLGWKKTAVAALIYRWWQGLCEEDDLCNEDAFYNIEDLRHEDLCNMYDLINVDDLSVLCNEKICALWEWSVKSIDWGRSV